MFTNDRIQKYKFLFFIEKKTKFMLSYKTGFFGQNLETKVLNKNVIPAFPTKTKVLD